MSHPASPAPRRIALVAAMLLALATSGCAVITVASTATSVAVTGASLAVGAGVGAVKLTGRAVGAAVDLAVPDSNTD
ncbi:hypothetical protein EZ242_09060 [Ramlibacter rhizophilus]|uniref:Lipoprotein n=2 Tax=Ramlibacter rhizophilus TaxID=1781167 RepID=A0A4Z0BSV5_9BURK|nr:hypothetical protein EZ242_09060 [Ramlibacter rhizophilus]